MFFYCAESLLFFSCIIKTILVLSNHLYWLQWRFFNLARMHMHTCMHVMIHLRSRTHSETHTDKTCRKASILPQLFPVIIFPPLFSCCFPLLSFPDIKLSIQLASVVTKLLIILNCWSRDDATSKILGNERNAMLTAISLYKIVLNYWWFLWEYWDQVKKK